MGGFRSTTAIITGGASGIGRALGEELARRGATVVLADIDRVLAEETAACIAREGGQAEGVHLDVTDAEAVKTLIEGVARDHGRLDYLFNNAGIAIIAEAKDHDLDDWTQTLDVNLRGVIHGVHAAYPIMRTQGSGHIINTASVAGLIPAINEIAYAASKHAVVGLSTVLRAEASAYGVRVSVVCPGFVDTPILFENIRMKHADRAGFTCREDVKRHLPVKCMPADQAARVILAGVSRNRGIILVTPHAKLLWWLQRLSPVASMGLATASMQKMRKVQDR